MWKRPRFYSTLQCAWHLICRNYFLWYFCSKIYCCTTFGCKALIELSDLVFYIGPFFGCKALLKMMASILTPVNSFWSRRFWKFCRLKLTLEPSPHIGPSFWDCPTHRAFPHTFETPPILQGYFAFVFETDAFVNWRDL